MTVRLSILIAGALFAAAAALPASAGSIPETPEAGGFKLGIEPWLGYGQWHVAAQKGLFAKAGLTGVEIVNFTQDKDINAALASGELDAANIATHTAMGMIAAGLPVKIVMLLDFSLSADAVLAGPDVKTVEDLKGKQIAYEEGTTSDILINYALASKGLSIADVTPVPMPASDAGSALIAGQVPVAVTYEPYISAARKEKPETHLLFTAGENPGLVSDVLVVRDEVLKEKPGQVLAMLKTWDAALADYKANTEADRAIIAEAVGSAPADLATAFDGVQYYSVAEARAAFAGPFRDKTFADVLAAAKNAKLLEADVKAADLIVPDFVDAVK